MLQNAIYQRPQGRLITRMSFDGVPEIVITGITAKHLSVQLTRLTGVGSASGGSFYRFALSSDNGATYLSTLSAGTNRIQDSGTIISVTGSGSTQVRFAGDTSTTAPEQRPYSGNIMFYSFADARPTTFAGNCIGRATAARRVLCWGVETSGVALNAIRISLENSVNFRGVVSVFDVGYND